ncbi:DUF3788 domain-containing protein [Pseudolactococcus reticulitermitis]|uniref:DUF3788 domain-containing protein n=1 Tax=Pseudolactococcus reticulitermitis TaxID=2025039 RepID=A0A224WXV0_9LACT|nr:DUF3788 domain-containing protein [Lactococcus reticulitermitis]GAX47008.1 hypothetical protein RsY01_589 [Lactococcus reticulitermitis]
MLEKKASRNDMLTLLGKPLYDIWMQLNEMIDARYEMEQIWHQGGKAWTYEYKYRRGGKTLCTLYARENHFGFMVILGKYEREKFEADRESYSEVVQAIYDQTKTYHDGKWLMFEPTDTAMFADFIKLLAIKRKPNRK